jgi:hypothetical protein
MEDLRKPTKKFNFYKIYFYFKKKSKKFYLKILLFSLIIFILAFPNELGSYFAFWIREFMLGINK